MSYSDILVLPSGRFGASFSWTDLRRGRKTVEGTRKAPGTGVRPLKVGFSIPMTRWAYHFFRLWRSWGTCSCLGGLNIPRLARCWDRDEEQISFPFGKAKSLKRKHDRCLMYDYDKLDCFFPSFGNLLIGSYVNEAFNDGECILVKHS